MTGACDFSDVTPMAILIKSQTESGEQIVIINPGMIWRQHLLKHQSGLLNEFDNWLSVGYVFSLFVSVFPFAASFSALYSRDPQYSEVMGTIDLERTMTTHFLTLQRDKMGLHV